MFSVLKNATYRHLFLAQVISLIGTSLGTVALGLLAFDLAGENAGAVLGTAFAIKMIAYVSLAPIAGAFADVLPRRVMLVGLNVARALKQDILNLAERQRVTDVHHIRETNNFG